MNPDPQAEEGRRMLAEATKEYRYADDKMMLTHKKGWHRGWKWGFVIGAVGVNIAWFLWTLAYCG